MSRTGLYEVQQRVGASHVRVLWQCEKVSYKSDKTRQIMEGQDSRRGAIYNYVEAIELWLKEDPLLIQSVERLVLKT